MPEKRYIIPLSDVDRMIIRQDRAGHLGIDVFCSIGGANQ